MPKPGAGKAYGSSPSASAKLIVFDLGNASGRVSLGSLEDERLRTEEIYRFVNGPSRLGQRWYWDVLRLHAEVMEGLRRAATILGEAPATIGIDSWGVDYAYLDASGAVMAPMRHMRDPRTDGVYEAIHRRLSRGELYRRTGAMTIQINTLAQLYAERREQPWLQKAAATLLFTSDLINYFLTGLRVSDVTIASTSQFLDPARRAWRPDVLSDLGLASHFLPPLVEPGTVLGPLLPEVRSAAGLGAGVQAVAVAGHDTAAAVAATPFAPGRRAAFISAGTWSLLGREIIAPDLSDASLDSNFTNECGVGGAIVHHKILCGLWLVQECRRIWSKTAALDYADLDRAANAQPPLAFVFDPDDPRFLTPSDMPAAIVSWFRDRGLPAPEGVGPIARAIYDSLALNHRHALDDLARLGEGAIEEINLVGGGVQAALLAQATSDAAGLPVLAGPQEATVAGNMLCQLLAAGAIADLEEGRAMIRRSNELATYRPRERSAWETASVVFRSLKAASR
ncbi:rhamnulokinase [Roseiarcus sp.]|uniref:rhamnulokinase n=1 Tax=Roseiarcus sp. TaxID=1969460 RepID=UPI003F95C74F